MVPHYLRLPKPKPKNANTFCPLKETMIAILYNVYLLIDDVIVDDVIVDDVIIYNIRILSL